MYGTSFVYIKSKHVLLLFGYCLTNIILTLNEKHIILIPEYKATGNVFDLEHRLDIIFILDNFDNDKYKCIYQWKSMGLMNIVINL